MQELKFHTVVVGSGAAGLNAADRLRQYGVGDIALITENRKAGTSRNTGSDKQTYYKLSLAGGQGDSVRRLAEILYEGGCVDGDNALCEAALSCQGFYKLVELGVPFPHNRMGEYVGYKTDHDPNNRGTSVGPYTSRYMTEALERQVDEKHIPVYDFFQVVKILTLGGKLFGILCLNTRTGEFVRVQCTNLVYATGGPAGMYRNSVYPVSQFGASGIAYEAGVYGQNLTEWQYGLASLRPRWNVSGSYMQALPRFVSTDQAGNDEREFLAEFFDRREEMLDMVFLKGYQWPFDVRKVQGGSSVIDLLVYRESAVRGRRVWLDFRQNPGKSEIAFEKLSEETRDYLKNADACKQTPFERLRSLNAPAAEFYLEHGTDLKEQMLEIAVCAQHNNGGLSVDGWWRTNIEGIFAVGEAAGTHGIYRPGGSALNAGQVGSTRAARYIAAHREQTREWSMEELADIEAQTRQCIRMGQSGTKKISGENWIRATEEMSRIGAMLRDPKEIEEMLAKLKEELAGFTESEESCGAEDAGRLSRFYRYYDMRLCQYVYLTAMLDYYRAGGRSRGSAIYAESGGEAEEKAAGDPAEQAAGTPAETVSLPGLVRFTLDGEDGMAHADTVQVTGLDREGLVCRSYFRPVRRLDDFCRDEAFEKVWKEYREGKVFDESE